MQQETQTSPPRLTAGGREYQIRLTLGLGDKIAERTGVDLVGDDARDQIFALMVDQRKLAAVLWQFCESQAEVDRDAFLESLDGATLAEGWQAVVDAVVFFIHPLSREQFEIAFEQQMAAWEAGTANLRKMIQSEESQAAIAKTLREMQTKAQRDFEKALGESA